jgi:hypothetical protein
MQNILASEILDQVADAVIFAEKAASTPLKSIPVLPFIFSSIASLLVCARIWIEVPI